MGVPSQSQVLGGSAAAAGVCYNYQLSKVSLVTRIKWPIREECGNIFSIIKCEKLFTFGNIFGIFCVIAARPQPRGGDGESNCPAESSCVMMGSVLVLSSGLKNNSLICRYFKQVNFKLIYGQSEDQTMTRIKVK